MQSLAGSREAAPLEPNDREGGEHVGKADLGHSRPNIPRRGPQFQVLSAASADADDDPEGDVLDYDEREDGVIDGLGERDVGRIGGA